MGKDGMGETVVVPKELRRPPEWPVPVGTMVQMPVILARVVEGRRAQYAQMKPGSEPPDVSVKFIEDIIAGACDHREEVTRDDCNRAFALGAFAACLPFGWGHTKTRADLQRHLHWVIGRVADRESLRHLYDDNGCPYASRQGLPPMSLTDSLYAISGLVQTDLDTHERRWCEKDGVCQVQQRVRAADRQLCCVLASFLEHPDQAEEALRLLYRSGVTDRDSAALLRGLVHTRSLAK